MGDPSSQIVWKNIFGFVISSTKSSLNRSFLRKNEEDKRRKYAKTYINL